MEEVRSVRSLSVWDRTAAKENVDGGIGGRWMQPRISYCESIGRSGRGSPPFLLVHPRPRGRSLVMVKRRVVPHGNCEPNKQTFVAFSHAIADRHGHFCIDRGAPPPPSAYSSRNVVGGEQSHLHTATDMHDFLKVPRGH